MRPPVVLLFSVAAVFGTAQVGLRESLLNETLRSTLVKDRMRNTLPVVRALHSPEPKLRRAAAIALREMDPEVSRAPEVPADAFRPIVVRALAYASLTSPPEERDEAILSLLVVLRNRDWGHHGEPWSDPRELQPLVDLGPVVVPTLARVLRDKDAGHGTKISAVRVLSKIRSMEGLSTLLELIAQEEGFLVSSAMQAATAYDDPRVARAIVASLGKSIHSYQGTPGLWALKRMKARAVPAMIEALSGDGEESLRAMVAWSFGQIVDPRARPHLVLALKESDDGIAAAEATALSAYNHPTVVKALIGAKSDRSPLVRANALTSLGKLRSQAARGFAVHALGDGDLGVRRAAIFALAEIDPKGSAPLLLPFLLEAETRYATVCALRSAKDRRTIPALLQVLRSREEQTFEQAAGALAEMGAEQAIPDLIESLDSPSYYQTNQFLALFGKRAVQPLLHFFPRAKNKLAVAETIGRIRDPRVVSFLLQHLETAELTYWICESLGFQGDRRAIGPLLRVLAAEKDLNAGQAAAALGELRATEAVEPLLAAMSREEVRWEAAGGLAKIGNPRALEPLLAYLTRDPNQDGMWMAIESLGNFRDPRVFALLTRALSGRWGSRAAFALGEYGDRKALPYLRRATESDDDELVAAAQKATKRLLSRPTASPGS